MWRKKCNWKNIFFRLNYWQELLMCEFISQDVTLNSDTLIMSEFIVACFAWSAALSIGVLPLQSPAAVKGIITFLFVIYHDAKILFVKTLEILLPAVVSGYQRMSWAGGWSQGLWSSFLRAAQYWQTVPSIPTQLGTHSKKINYGFSEHGPISSYPPSFYGFSEQNYSENWWSFYPPYLLSG